MRRSFLIATLRHYRAINALVVAGVAIAVAVLSGALLVGASVRASLRDLALTRLGHTDVVASAPGFFRTALAAGVTSPEIAAVVPVVAIQAAVAHQDSGRTAARVNVFGVDDRFFAFHDRKDAGPQGRNAWVSVALATELGAAAGDDLVLRVARPTDIPLGHLQGRRDAASERVRLTVRQIVPRAELGEFSLLPSQGPALTVFVALSRLQQDLGIGDRANTLLVRMAPPLRDPVADVRSALAPAVQLDDVGLRVRTTADDQVILESRTGLLAPPVWQPAATRAQDRGGSPVGVLTYLANTIRANGREIPYSLIAAIGEGDARISGAGAAVASSDRPPLRLNAWAAEDLGVAIGDRIDVEYYLWSDREGLLTRSTSFSFAGVVPMEQGGADPSLTPEYPGITDAADVTSWDPPFPVDLKRVRKKDEEYWDRWRAAPKAFIPLSVGQQLWSSPYGNLSSLRTAAVPDWPPVPEPDAAFTIRHARAEALAAANGTTDFGEYFVYFSFFLVISALLLAGMFFALSVEQRSRELGLLLAVGFRQRDVRRVLLNEAIVLAGAGALAGIAGAIGYAAVIVYGLRTWWIGAVNTTALQLHLDPLLLIGGAIGAVLTALAALAAAFRRLTRTSARALLLGSSQATVSPRSAGRARRAAPIPRLVSGISLVLAAALIAAGFMKALPPVGAFFGAGMLLMIAGCAVFSDWLRPRRIAQAAPSVFVFGLSYARWRPTRSVLSAALIAFACFVIVAVGAFRREAAGTSLSRESGTGGFVLMAESIAPLMHNPNLPAGRAELALSDSPELASALVARFRLRPGDEVSCLTLYQPTNPRIIAPEESFLQGGRFTFAQSLAATDEERANPWLLLEKPFEDGAVPAIVDQTSLTYVFHRKVGDDFTFTPEGTDPVRLRIVGALADSVLQSELIIGESQFVRLFPRNEGYRVWLIEAPEASAAALTTTLEDRLSDFGVDVTDTRARLASYHQVENTYLSTFQALGALGLLLGTFGLAAVLARNVFERRRELGLLGAVGFTAAHLRTLVTAEALLLVGTGVAIGTASALVAIAPAIVERASAIPYGSLVLLVAAVVATGLLASIMAVRVATSTPVVDALKAE
jgi:ABC-type lipoprotein release transport system permease subunit